MDAGRRFGLRPGRTLIGRGDACDVTLASSTVSVQHCAVDVDPLGEVVVADLGSRNGTRIGSEIVRDRRKVAPGEIMLLGAVQLMMCDPERNDRPALLGAQRTAGGNIAFNRPPRPMPVADTAAAALPKSPRESTARQPFSWISMLAPLALAAVMVKVGGSFTYALFALLSPVMLAGSGRPDRRRRAGAAAAADVHGDVARLGGLSGVG